MLSVLGLIRKAGGGGGGGGLSVLGLIRKAGGGAVRFTPDAKSEWERAVLSASGPIRKVGVEKWYGGAHCS